MSILRRAIRRRRGATAGAAALLLFATGCVAADGSITVPTTDGIGGVTSPEGAATGIQLLVLLTVLSLLLLGGATVQGFLLVILVGVIAGTYSSIGVAAQLLVAFDERDLPRAWARLRGRDREQAAA